MTIALRRPLLTVFTLGCCVSLMVSGRLTLRLLVPVMLYATLIPLCEVASLALVVRTRELSFWRAVDPFLRSDELWLFLLTIYCAIWAFVPVQALFGRSGFQLIWYTAAVIAFATTAASIATDWDTSNRRSSVDQR